MRLVFQVAQRLDDVIAQPAGVGGGQVGQPSVLAPPPDQLVRVQLRGLGRQRLGDAAGMRGPVGRHGRRAAVAATAVPQHRPAFTPPRPQLVEEADDVLGTGLLVVAEDLKIQVGPPPLGADGAGADGRQPVAAVRAFADRRLAARGPRPADGRGEQVARFVEERPMRSAVGRRPGDAGEGRVPPPGDRLLVALAGWAARLLGRPVQAGAEEPADVIGVLGDAEVAADQFGDAGGGPQAVRPPVSVGQRPQPGAEAPVGRRGQLGRRVSPGLRGQPAGRLSVVEPAGDGAAADAGGRGPRRRVARRPARPQRLGGDGVPIRRRFQEVYSCRIRCP